jgi:trimeric autotransporter adhesin
MSNFQRLLCVLFVLISGVCQASAPTLLNYQSQLTTAGGAPVVDGSYSIVFSIYDAPVGGATKWTETQAVVTSGGRLSVLLGTITPIADSVFGGINRYLGVKVGADPEMTPRMRMVTSPYAFRVNTVDGSTGGAISGNLSLDTSSATTGNIFKGGALFIHNSGSSNLFMGRNAGNLTMTGNGNVAIGDSALHANTTGYLNTAVGYWALLGNSSGGYNTAVGDFALPSNSSGANNTAVGANALNGNTSGVNNTSFGFWSLFNTSTGNTNTAVGAIALYTNVTGTQNTGIGYAADVSSAALSNATAIGYGAVVDASNKIRLGNNLVTTIEGQVAYTFTSDRNQKENFRPVDGEEVLGKIQDMKLTSWNYKNNESSQFRHYGPMAQDFFAAFGHDAVGQCGDSVSINSGDEAGIMMVAIQALEKRTTEMEALKAENLSLKTQLDELKAVVGQLVVQAKRDDKGRLTAK